MTPPLCLWCEDKPVQKTWSGRELCQRPTGEGVAMWRNYCSRRCAGQAAMAALTPQERAIGTARIIAHNREAMKRRIVTTIRDVVGARYRDGDPVSLAQLIRLAREAERQGYFKGWQQRRRLGARARVA